MRFDQNVPTKRTDLVCDDLPPIEAQQLNRFLLPINRCYEQSLEKWDGLYCSKGGCQEDLILIKKHPPDLVWVMARRYVCSLLDAINHEEIFVLLLFFNVRWGELCLGADWLETNKRKSTNQIWAIKAVLSDAQDNAVALKLLLGKLQQRDERVLRCLVRHSWRQVHVQNVVQWAEDRFPDAVLLRCYVQFQRNLRWSGLG